MTRSFLQNITEDGDGNPVVDADEYTIEVTEARAPEGKTIFMDLKIIGGPKDGTVTSVSLYVPEDGEKGLFYFRKKTRGFAAQLATIPANVSDDEQLQAIADAITGARCEATLGIQSKGEYAGSQELLATRPLEGGAAPAATPTAPAAAPAAAAPAPAAPAPAPAPAAAPAPAPAAAPAVATPATTTGVPAGGDVPPAAPAEEPAF